jgi:BirA family biotin operon repressor/biotin-[acetyl-CoA-carboxylase] ligase
LNEALLKALPDFGSVQWVDSTGSTNADLIQRLKALQANTTHQGPARPWLLGAHLQTAGKGRAGRPWTNTAGSTLMFSCAFEPNIPLARLPAIAPALGVTTCLALRSLLAAHRGDTGLEPLTLKWPNDLQWHGAKLAGLLIETGPSAQVVVGMGLNLKGAAALSLTLEREIADLGMIQTQALPSAAQIVTHVALAWQQALKDYAEQGYAAFRDPFDTIDALAGQPVQVIDQGHILHLGIAQGTDEHGRLRVMTDAGLIPVLVGDVSIRPANTLQAKGTP